jgi:anaerobic ribonucleoside-triphosphate reductase activating protein
MKIRVCGITRESVVDGPGLRAVVYVQGCLHGCRGCHNPSTWDCAGGYELDLSEIVFEIRPNKLLRGLTISGGEPFLQAGMCAQLARRVKAAGMDIVTYTGYTWEELSELALQDQGVAEFLDETDILIDGPYLEEEKDLSLSFRGSRNQRIIDLPATRKAGKVVTLDY